MARILSRTVTADITLVVNTVHDDDTVETREINVSNTVQGLRYVEDEQVKVVNGNVASFTLQSLKYKGRYRWDSKDDFANRVKVTDILVDASKSFDSNFVNVNPFEIVEDEGVENVKRVYTVPKLAGTLSIAYTDGSENTYPLVPDTFLENLRFRNEDGETDTIGTYRIITLQTSMTKNIDTEISITGLVLQDGSNVITVRIGNIMGLDGVIEKTTDSQVITDAISGDAKIVVIGNTTYTEPVRLTKAFTILGENYNIPANVGRRAVDDKELAGETIFSGGIKVLDGATQVVFDGITFTGDALVDIGKAKEVEFRNCRFVGIVASKMKTMYVTSTEYSDKTPVKLTVSNCYFGTPEEDGTKKMFNIFELLGYLANGSSIRNCYFVTQACWRHAVAIYNIEENGVITIADNIFEYSNNAIRVSTMYSEKGTVHIVRNTYLRTADVSDGENPGLLMIAPYTTLTTSMKKIRINVTNTVHYDKYPIGYRFYVDGEDTPLTNATSPEVYINNIKTNLPLIIKG